MTEDPAFLKVPKSSNRPISRFVASRRTHYCIIRPTGDSRPSGSDGTRNRFQFGQLPHCQSLALPLGGEKNG